MKKRAGKGITKEPPPSWVRASISFPPNLYTALGDIATSKKVSLAWVVRDAVEKYVSEQHLSFRA